MQGADNNWAQEAYYNGVQGADNNWAQEAYYNGVQEAYCIGMADIGGHLGWLIIKISSISKMLQYKNHRFIKKCVRAKSRFTYRLA